MKRTGMNEDGKEFMKLILSVIVIVLCSGCFRNNSPISVELSSVERNDTLYLEFEFTNNTEDSLFFEFSNILYTDCLPVQSCREGLDCMLSYEERMERRKSIESFYNNQNFEKKVSLLYPYTSDAEIPDFPCILQMVKEYNSYKYYGQEPDVSVTSEDWDYWMSDIWLDKEFQEKLLSYFVTDSAFLEEFENGLPLDLLFIMPQSTKKIEVDISYLKFLKTVYTIELDYMSFPYEDDSWDATFLKIENLGYKPYAGRLTSNSITIDTRKMKLP